MFSPINISTISSFVLVKYYQVSLSLPQGRNKSTPHFLSCSSRRPLLVEPTACSHADISGFHLLRPEPSVGAKRSPLTMRGSTSAVTRETAAELVQLR